MELVDVAIGADQRLEIEFGDGRIGAIAGAAGSAAISPGAAVLATPTNSCANVRTHGDTRTHDETAAV